MLYVSAASYHSIRNIVHLCLDQTNSPMLTLEQRSIIPRLLKFCSKMNSNSNTSSFFTSLTKRIIANMLIILSLLLIFTNLHQTTAQIDYAEIARQAAKFWRDFNEIPKPPKLLLRFQDKHKVKQKIVKWDKSKIDPSQGPFAHVFSIADRLARGRDITNCDMQYYDEREPIDIGVKSQLYIQTAHQFDLCHQCYLLWRYIPPIYL